MQPMRHRIDPLIAERAPWLYRASLPTRLLRGTLERLLSYPETLALARRYAAQDAPRIMADLGARLARNLRVRGLHHIPRHGPALVVANHPTGIGDGVVLHALIAPLRPDLFYYANRDVCRVLPQLGSLIAPVEWRAENRSPAAARETLQVTRAWLDAGRLGVIFPSGRLAKRRGLTLHERPWMASAARLAHKFDLPVVPIHLRARNSALFYLFDMIHPTLRDITLFHETLNKARQPYEITVGAPISPRAIPTDPAKGIAMLRAATLSLAAPPRLDADWRRGAASQV